MPKIVSLLGLGMVLAVALPGVVGVATAHYCRAEPGDMSHPAGCDPHNCSSAAAATSSPLAPEPSAPFDFNGGLTPLLPPPNPLSIPMQDAGPLRMALSKADGQVFGIPEVPQLPEDLVPDDLGVLDEATKPWHWHTVKHASSGDTFKHHCSSWGAMGGVEDILPV